jgi:hypothetical protein
LRGTGEGPEFYAASDQEDAGPGFRHYQEWDVTQHILNQSMTWQYMCCTIVRKFSVSTCLHKYGTVPIMIGTKVAKIL